MSIAKSTFILHCWYNTAHNSPHKSVKYYYKKAIYGILFQYDHYEPINVENAIFHQIDRTFGLIFIKLKLSWSWIWCSFVNLVKIIFVIAMIIVSLLESPLWKMSWKFVLKFGQLYKSVTNHLGISFTC
jgi:hypothetical protein